MTVHAVTAVVVNHNSGDLLRSCLEDLVRQSVDHVVVIDNASTDGSVVHAEREGVTLVRSADNVGFAAGVNLALQHTSDPYVLLLNADVELAEGYVARLRQALDDDPRLAGATGVLTLPSGEVDSSGITVTTAHWASDRDRGRSPRDVETRAPFGVSGAAALLRRSALDSLGDEPLWSELFVYWDDVELAWRLRRVGWDFACCLEARGVHQRGSDTAAADFVEGANFGNRLATVARHEGILGLLRPSSVAVTLVVLARLSLRHRAALRRAAPVRRVRTGLAARRSDESWPSVPGDVFAPHPWRGWLVAQLTGSRRGFGSLREGTRTLSARREDRH